MQNRFGFKDFVSLVLLLVVGILVVLAMKQFDRQYKMVLSVEQSLGRLERNVGSIDTRTTELGEGVRRLDQTARATSDSVAELKSRIDSGVKVVGGGDGGEINTTAPGSSATIGGSPAASTTATSPATPTDPRDTSWANADVPIDWQDAVSYTHDPREMEGFREGGRFTEVFPAQPSKITAILAEDTYGRRIADFVYESLGEYDPQSLKLVGRLADAWQIDPQGLWLRARIRAEARFSDGRPVTAEDVRWSFHDYLMNPELETESLRSIMRSITEVRVISDRAVEFRFSVREAFNKSKALAGLPVLPKHFYSQFTPSQINQSTGLLMGSGPFRVANLNPSSQWTPGTDVVLLRNEQYWGPRAPLAELRFRAIDNELSRLVAFQNGDVSMIEPSSPQFAEKSAEEEFIAKAYALKWLNMRSGYAFIAWQCGPRGGPDGKPTPFSDRRVRLAMTHLIDRQKMIDTIYSGIGEVAVANNNKPSPAAPDVEPWPYNPVRAMELLKEAGWEKNAQGLLQNADGKLFEFEFTRTSGSQIVERLGKFLEDSFARAGIRMTQRPVDWSQFDQILKTRDFDAITMGWSASAPESDPTQIWHTDSIQNQGHNFIQWRHADQDRLIEAIRSEMDDEKRMALHRQFGELLHQEQPYTFMRAVPWLRFIDRGFDNVHPYPKGLAPQEYFWRGPAGVSAVTP